MTDPKGLGLDRTGVIHAGRRQHQLSDCLYSKGQTQYVSYITRTERSRTRSQTAVQATGDSGGTYKQVTDGEYVYTFATKLPNGYDQTVTHTVGIYGSRILTDFDLGTQYASTTYNFVPNGSKVTVTRDVVKTASPATNATTSSRSTADRAAAWNSASCATPRRPPIPAAVIRWI